MCMGKCNSLSRFICQYPRKAFFFKTLEYHEDQYTTANLFSTHQIWEYCSSPTKECSGLLKTDGSIFKLAREELHIVGWRGVPVLTAKHELIYPIGTVWIRPVMLKTDTYGLDIFIWHDKQGGVTTTSIILYNNNIWTEKNCLT